MTKFEPVLGREDKEFSVYRNSELVATVFKNQEDEWSYRLEDHDLDLFKDSLFYNESIVSDLVYDIIIFISHLEDGYDYDSWCGWMNEVANFGV